MLSKTLTLALTLSSSVFAQEPESTFHWIADFDEAVEAAKASGKDMLVDFTGSDWCGWCHKLDGEVFDTDEFKSAAPEMFVLVKLDFPRAEEVKAKVPNPKRNAEIGEKYGVRGYPTVLAMTADGMVFGRTGYQRGGPGPYLASLKQMIEVGKPNVKEAHALAAKLAGADAEAKKTMLVEILDKLESAEGDDPVAAVLGDHLKAAFDDGSLKAAELELRGVKVLLRIGQAGEGVIAAAERLDEKNEAGLLDKVVESKFGSVRDDAGAKAALSALDGLAKIGFKDAALEKNLVFTAMRWSAGPLQDKERAKGYGARLKEIAGDDERMMKMVEQILGG